MKVFISYAHHDRVPAQACEQWLLEGGFQPIRDETKFASGPIPGQIRTWIKDCDLFLVVLTHNYYNSPWASDELGQARAFDKPILFVASDETQPQGPDSQTLPLPLYRKEFSVWRAHLLRAAKEHVGRKTADSDPSIEQWLTRTLGCNKWVEARTAAERTLHIPAVM